VADLRLLDFFDSLFAQAELHRVDSVLLLRLDLSDLASVQLDDGAALKLTPLVPEVSAADLVADGTDSTCVSYCRFSRLNVVLRVDFLFKTLESRLLTNDTVLLVVAD